jgi:hypothetical protein
VLGGWLSQPPGLAIRPSETTENFALALASVWPSMRAILRVVAGRGIYAAFRFCGIVFYRSESF